MEDKIKMKNTTIMLIILIMISLVGGFIFVSSGNSENGTTETGNIDNGEVQKIILSEKDLNYYPNTIKIKSGKLVELSLDGSVKGCLRSLVIKSLGISRYLATPSDVLTFTPDKKGTFAFACSMGMGYGKLIVE